MSSNQIGKDFLALNEIKEWQNDENALFFFLSPSLSFGFKYRFNNSSFNSSTILHSIPSINTYPLSSSTILHSIPSINSFLSFKQLKWRIKHRFLRTNTQIQSLHNWIPSDQTQIQLIQTHNKNPITKTKSITAGAASIAQKCYRHKRSSGGNCSPICTYRSCSTSKAFINGLKT